MNEENEKLVIALLQDISRKLDQVNANIKDLKYTVNSLG